MFSSLFCINVLKEKLCLQFTLYFAPLNSQKYLKPAGLTYVSYKCLPTCMPLYIFTFFVSFFFLPLSIFLFFSPMALFFFLSTPCLHDQTLCCMVSAVPRYPTLIVVALGIFHMLVMTPNPGDPEDHSF